MQIQADHVRRLLLEVRVVRRQVPLQPVRPEIRPPPRPVHDRVAHSQVLSQPPRAPVRRAIQRRGPGGRQDLRLHRRSQNRPGVPLRFPGRQRRHPPFTEPLAPLVDVGRGTAESVLDRNPRRTGCQQQNDLRPPGVLLANRPRTGSSFQLAPFRRSQDDAISGHGSHCTLYYLLVQPTRWTQRRVFLRQQTVHVEI